MKKYSAILWAAAAVTGVAMQSCVSDEPFGDGEGQLKMKMVINSTLTRSADDEQALRDECAIYISGSKGLLYKFKGIDQVPSDLWLKSGSYVAEAWTGDSVSASFDKKFYKAYEPFDITRGDIKNVVLNCKIANVVASINPEDIISQALRDYTLTVSNTRGSLDFNAENAATAHGYFMMPDGETSLHWKITGTRENGEAFTKEGDIENVERAHEYVLNIRYTPLTSDLGGGFITVTVDDTTLVVEDVVDIFGAPVISGVGYDIASPLIGESGSFERKSVYIQSLTPLSALKVHTSSAAALGIPTADFDFVSMTDEARAALQAAGISCTLSDEEAGSNARIFFDSDMLNRLSDGEYAFQITATDRNGKTRVRTLTITVSNASVVLTESPWTDIYATSATLYGTIMKSEVTNPGFRYRAVGETAWNEVAASAVSAARKYRRSAGTAIKATVKGLRPGTRYEYQAIADGYVNTQSMYFNTESAFVLPNAGFEQWSTHASGWPVASATGTPDFWDSGNQGANMASTVITYSSTEVKHSGNYSACLDSKKASVFGIGKLAAGNIFAGTYDKTSGTNGELTFGRPFNGSRPVKLRGWAYYHPGTIDEKGSYSGKTTGDTDEGQLYVALTTDVFKIKTADTSTLFNPQDSRVLAYGQITFTSDYGSASAMREFEITLDYRAAAALQRASYVILVASASKYGDYFTGSTGSILYLDDLEFVYE